MQCNESFTSDNIIPILPTSPAEIDRATTRAQRLKEQGLTHSLKKASGSGKKRKKQNGDSTVTEDANTTTTSEVGLAPPIPKNGSKKSNALPSINVLPPTTTTTTGGIKDASTASLTAKVLEDERQRNKKRKLGMNENLKTL